MNGMRLLLLLVFGVQFAWTGPIAGQTRFEREILQVLEEYVRATNEGDVRRLSELYLDSPTTGSVGDGAVYRGWETVADLIAGIYSVSGTVQLSGTGVTITPLGPDAAVVYFETEWAVGEERVTRSRGAMTIVFVRTEDGWRVAHDHTSTSAGSQQTVSGVAAPGGGPGGPVREPEPCRVSRIVDGDTIDCAPLGRIRLIGMDTPESDQDPFGDMATEYLASLIPVGSEAAIEPDVEAQDRYGRALGYVWADGVMVNWAMVRAGYAVLLTYPPNVQYVEWFRQAQEQAREEGAGLWAVDGFECLPQEHRRRICEDDARVEGVTPPFSPRPPAPRPSVPRAPLGSSLMARCSAEHLVTNLGACNAVRRVPFRRGHHAGVGWQNESSPAGGCRGGRSSIVSHTCCRNEQLRRQMFAGTMNPLLWRSCPPVLAGAHILARPPWQPTSKRTQPGRFG